MVDTFIKLQWIVFVALGMCFTISPALAKGTPVPDYFSSDLLSNAEKSVFADKAEDLHLAQNKSYSSAQTERTALLNLRGKTKLDSNYFKGIFSDVGYALTSPLRWDSSDWGTASIVAGVTGGLFLLDDEIKNAFQNNRSSTTDDVSKIFEHFGNGAVAFPALAGLYLYGRFGKYEKIERTALLATEGFLVTGLFSTVLKVATGRPRPFKGGSSSTFDGFSTSSNSFPSGHTSTIFAIATVVANEYDNVPLVAPISYGIATLTGLSRINDNKHWASDVFFAAALGYFTSKVILKLHSNKKGRHYTIYPRVNSRGGGLELSAKF
jgi:membrane-associated phospholipid phosphatase